MSIKTKRVLCVGLEVHHQSETIDYVHCPLIEIVPRDISLDISKYTHLIFTSKTAVRLFSKLTERRNFITIAVGKATASALQKEKFIVQGIAEDECAEGVVKVLEGIDLKGAYILWPHAARARSIIKDYLRKQNVNFDDVELYDTVTRKPPIVPNLSDVDAIYFTSPSTVDAFLEVFGSFPDLELMCIGPVTQKHLEKKL